MNFRIQISVQYRSNTANIFIVLFRPEPSALNCEPSMREAKTAWLWELQHWYRGSGERFLGHYAPGRLPTAERTKPRPVPRIDCQKWTPNSLSEASSSCALPQQLVTG